MANRVDRGPGCKSVFKDRQASSFLLERVERVCAVGTREREVGGAWLEPPASGGEWRRVGCLFNGTCASLHPAACHAACPTTRKNRSPPIFRDNRPPDAGKSGFHERNRSFLFHFFLFFFVYFLFFSLSSRVIHVMHVKYFLKSRGRKWVEGWLLLFDERNLLLFFLEGE